MKYRVIQWATGSMGKACLRAVIDHPDLELVGLFVYSDHKAGRDAGDIARRPPTGVIATSEKQAILDLEADVVIHAPRIQFPYRHHNQDMCDLLASGKNLISINGHVFPAWHGAASAAAFEQAGRQGNATLWSKRSLLPPAASARSLIRSPSARSSMSVAPPITIMSSTSAAWDPTRSAST